jgi:hypothetical protein
VNGERRSVVGAIAVGNLSFVEKLKSELRFKAAHPAALRRFNGDLACSDPWPTHLPAKMETYEQEIVKAFGFPQGEKR